ncbi:hypothetical protein A3862_15520 [Methylobacterium sp. XJLW]|nr:hypothetical protein A3862_15520 [Methylobacterium sp. XJLW]
MKGIAELHVGRASLTPSVILPGPRAVMARAATSHNSSLTPGTLGRKIDAPSSTAVTSRRWARATAAMRQV